LAGLPRSRLRAVAGLYRSAALRRTREAPAQPDYINSVAALETELSPLELLQGLQAIETAQGRVRREPWGARTLDLDLLLYGDLALHTQTLTLPHPQMAVRSFVLLPLRELVGEDFVLPGLGPLGHLLAQCPGPQATRLPE
jgi:2-amino-4-hydroxy-6-hydroxymethyldihydropteridine diphosphokinase